MPLSTYGRNVLAMALTGQGAIGSPMWIAFTTQIAGPEDTGDTLYEGVAQRLSVDFTTGWTSPDLGLVSLVDPMTFQAYEYWGVFDSYALCTAEFSGSVFAYDYLAAPLTVKAMATITIPANSFALQVT